VWAKSVPPFFAHEGRVVTCLTPVAPRGLLPRLVGVDPATRTVVLDDVPGEDGYAADHETVGRMIDLLVELQARTAAMVVRLLAIGAPDWRASALTAQLDRLVARADVADTISPADHATLTTLVSELPDRFAALAGCGMPDTLVHGDCHPGNWRVDGRALTLLDWGDAGVGHPLLDTAAATTFAEDDDERDGLLDRFVSAWRRQLPRADPATALSLARPIAALRQALIYRTLCDGVEPAERVHHEQDVGHWLRRAVAEDRATARARRIRVRRR
jgi:Ser/Thr protein kinase RdoA (MazF antagonist)